MAGKVKTWVWVILAFVVTCVLGVIAIAGAGLLLLHPALRHQGHARRQARRVEFEQVKAQFAGQKPLVELDERGNFVRANPDRPSSRNSARPEQLYVLAFDPDDGRIVKVTMPFWLLRLKITQARSTSTAAAGPRRSQADASRTSSASVRRSSSTTRASTGSVSSSGRSNCPVRCDWPGNFPRVFSAVFLTGSSRRESCDLVAPTDELGQTPRRTTMKRFFLVPALGVVGVGARSAGQRAARRLD